VTGVETHLPAYLLGRARRVLDAWGHEPGDERARLDERLVAAADTSARRVAGELRALLATPAVAQRATPLQILRDAPTETTAVLADVGVPAVVRDEHEERLAPDDRYGLAPRTFADLDAELGAVQLVWGAAKAAVVRSTPHPPPRQ
jgi:hypothetical protein